MLAVFTARLTPVCFEACKKQARSTERRTRASETLPAVPHKKNSFPMSCRPSPVRRVIETVTKLNDLQPDNIMNTETTNSEYLLLFHGTAWYEGLSAEQLQQAMNRFKAWFDRLSEQGVLKAAQPLVREARIVGQNGRVVADGPFAESKEAIGGYLLIAVNSFDEAVAIAKGCPGLEYGTQIEVRPVADECPMVQRAGQMMAQEQLASAAK